MAKLSKRDLVKKAATVARRARRVRSIARTLRAAQKALARAQNIGAAPVAVKKPLGRL